MVYKIPPQFKTGTVMKNAGGEVSLPRGGKLRATTLLSSTAKFKWGRKITKGYREEGVRNKHLRDWIR